MLLSSALGLFLPMILLLILAICLDKIKKKQNNKKSC